jgi:hypothetical protein
MNSKVDPRGGWASSPTFAQGIWDTLRRLKRSWVQGQLRMPRISSPLIVQFVNIEVWIWNWRVKQWIQSRQNSDTLASKSGGFTSWAPTRCTLGPFCHCKYLVFKGRLSSVTSLILWWALAEFNSCYGPSPNSMTTGEGVTSKKCVWDWHWKDSRKPKCRTLQEQQVLSSRCPAQTRWISIDFNLPQITSRRE